MFTGLFNDGLQFDLCNSYVLDHFKCHLDKYAPKKKWMSGNNKPYVTKGLRSAITKRSRLKARPRSLDDIISYKNKEPSSQFK